ncbi:MAG: hypothetical protein ACLSVD_06570 [Eggerthellaceae bacterium]
MIYRIALPLMVAAFLILPNVGVLGQAASGFLHECVLHRVLHPHHAHHG